MALRDTDYIYSSARIRAAEGTSSPRERIERMLESKSAGEIYAKLTGGENADIGSNQAVSENIGINEIDDAAENLVENAAHLMLLSAPEPDLLKFLLYQFDCTNLKTAIKCGIREIDARNMLYKFASVAPDDVISAVRDRVFDKFPENMRIAAPEAFEEYAKTSDPRSIDLVIDRACFADITHGAELTKSEFLINYAHAKADITNLLIFDRVSKMNVRIRESLLSRALVLGGEIPHEEFISAIENGREGLRGIISSTRYYKLCDVFSDSASSDDIERDCENFIIAPVSDIKYKPFGIEILAAYFITAEYEAKNSRIIAANIISDSGRSSDKIREAVRMAYV